MLISYLLQAPSLDEKVNLHFIAFVNVGGQLYELGELTTAKVRSYVGNICIICHICDIVDCN